MFAQLENGDSPVQVACTQEASNEVDVIWDWNSPQAKQQPKRIYRRPLSARSPKIPLKRYPSNNQMQNFDKLREELKNLKEAMSIPDNEDCLVLSPQQEQEYKDVKNFTKEEVISPQHDNFPIQDDDLFDDFADEQLVLCSQKIETELSNLEQVKNKLFCDSNDSLSSAKGSTLSVKEAPIKQECDSSHAKFNNNNNKLFSNAQNTECIADDSFDTVLETFNPASNDSFTAIFNQAITREDIKSKHVFSRTKSDNQYTAVKRTVGKVEFHRTESFESAIEHTKEIIPQSKLHEIERKRKEALAKLESKRKHESSDTPLKCTPQEIEQKRLEALAKREAKRQQDIIERKRKEALKRLEMSRKKNATIVKSSLTKRL